ncbi:O-antigen ligase family protein [Sodalis ligni]|uniref:O-antigen ligase n=1 Tax=Sodalis ligni TaxID=2697027 RepID=A0A4R1NDQ2_9GAMM|nr:O-antigen ligase family protein [Sodalis ligni]TCL05562.1 O-antigen ligase [Sodalis ligni]
MTSIRIKQFSEKNYIFFYQLFLLLSAIFCGYTKVNNIYHLSLILLGITLFTDNKKLIRLFLEDTAFRRGLTITAVFLMYFCLSTFWSDNPRDFISAITHSLYLLGFLFIYRQACLNGKKTGILLFALAGIMILLLLTFYCVDKKSILTNRLMVSFFAAPSNVIDLAGYFCIGIFLCLIIIRDTNNKWFYLPIPFLFIGVILTQSRGPLLSFVVSLLPLLLMKPAIRKQHIVIFLIFIIMLASFIVMMNFEYILFNRFETAYQQSFIRVGIWAHTLDMVQIHPFFGWGFNKELHFLNSLNAPVKTTHSLYLSTLLKGGIAGLFLLGGVLSYGLYMAKKHLADRQGFEAALFLFMIFFFTTQGMFIISNPGVTWYLFWFPLAVILSPPGKQTPLSV